MDLIDLEKKGFLTNTQLVNVTNDPVYHKTKKYNAIPLLPLLKKFTVVDSLPVENFKVVFECEDGYKPEMSLAKLLSSDVYVAISDAEAPEGSNWEQILKDGIEMKAAPFYVVYKNVSPKDYNYKWPYNLVKVHLEPLTVAEIPKSKNHPHGRQLYIQHCKVCHALNGAGGKMEPELNRPISITEYWKEQHLISFLENPQAYRENVKMPNLKITHAEAEAIVSYLMSIAKTNQ